MFRESCLIFLKWNGSKTFYFATKVFSSHINSNFHGSYSRNIDDANSSGRKCCIFVDEFDRNMPLSVVYQIFHFMTSRSIFIGIFRNQSLIKTNQKFIYLNLYVLSLFFVWIQRQLLISKQSNNNSILDSLGTTLAFNY